MFLLHIRLWWFRNVLYAKASVQCLNYFFVFFCNQQQYRTHDIIGVGRPFSQGHVPRCGSAVPGYAWVTDFLIN